MEEHEWRIITCGHTRIKEDAFILQHTTYTTRERPFCRQRCCQRCPCSAGGTMSYMSQSAIFPLASSGNSEGPLTACVWHQHKYARANCIHAFPKLVLEFCSMCSEYSQQQERTPVQRQQLGLYLHILQSFQRECDASSNSCRNSYGNSTTQPNALNRGRDECTWTTGSHTAPNAVQ